MENGRMDKLTFQAEGTVCEIPTYQEARDFIRGSLINMARNFIAIGYALKYIRDNQLYLEGGYSSIWECASQEYGFSKSTASRYMSMNDRFSKDGNSPVIQDQYQEFSKSQLQEMLSLNDEQLGQVTPADRVEDIRAMKKPREIPYVEIPGQGSLKEYPGFYPEEMLGERAEGPEEPGEPAEAVRPLASTGVHAVTAEDLIGEEDGGEVQSPGVAISQQPEEPQKEWKESAGCPPGIYGCRRQKWGTSEEQQAAGARECKKCWNEWKQTQKILSLNSSKGKENLVDSIDENHRRDTYCEALALSMLRTWWDWFLADFKNRVHDVAKAEQSIKAKIKESPQNHAWSFEGPDGQEVNALLFSEEIEFWQGEERIFLCGWFYLCAAIQGEWNSMATAKWHEKKAEEKRKEMAGTIEESEQEEDPGPQEQARCENSSEQPEDAAISQQGEMSDMDLLRNMLEKENGDLSEAIKINKIDPHPDWERMIRKKKLLVGALAGMLCDLENMAEPEEHEKPEQPDLPALKNNDQRKDWLNTYHDWPVWFEVPEAAEVYYRYDLEDGCSLVICEYHYWAEWQIHYGNDPERTGIREYMLVPGYHYLEDCKTNRTAMIDKLKEIQKR